MLCSYIGKKQEVGGVVKGGVKKIDSGDCTNCGNTAEATTLLQQFIKILKKFPQLSPRRFFLLKMFFLKKKNLEVKICELPVTHLYHYPIPPQKDVFRMRDQLATFSSSLFNIFLKFIT